MTSLNYVMTPNATDSVWLIGDNSAVVLNQTNENYAFTLTYYNGTDSYNSIVNDPNFQGFQGNGLLTKSWIEGQLCDFSVHFDISILHTPNNANDPRDIFTFHGFADPLTPISWQIEGGSVMQWSNPNHGFGVRVGEGETLVLKAIYAQDYVCNTCDPAPVPLPSSFGLLAISLVAVVLTSFCVKGRKVK